MDDTTALVAELQAQRAFLGDRAANLAVALAKAERDLEMERGRVRSLTRDLETARAAQAELPLGTCAPSGGGR